jgi:hypothetical protein
MTKVGYCVGISIVPIIQFYPIEDTVPRNAIRNSDDGITIISTGNV